MKEVIDFQTLCYQINCFITQAIAKQ